MSQNQFGCTSWDAVELKNNNNNNQKSRNDYLKLGEGSNQMRVITSPYEYSVHKYKEEGDTGFGDHVMCSIFHGSCPVCEKGDKPKRRWYVGVIDRKTGMAKILDIGVTVLKAIQEFSRDDDYGNPTKYDIDIKVDKNGGATGYYTVIPKPPKPLSSTDVALKEAFDVEELQRKVTPPTPEKVQERLDFLLNKKKKNNDSNEDSRFPSVK